MTTLTARVLANAEAEVRAFLRSPVVDGAYPAGNPGKSPCGTTCSGQNIHAEAPTSSQTPVAWIMAARDWIDVQLDASTLILMWDPTFAVKE